MRPPLHLVPLPGPHRVDVRGEVRADADGTHRVHPFLGAADVHRQAGTVAILTLEIRSGELRIDLDVHGSVQLDGLLTVTTAVRLRHAGSVPEEPDDDAGLDVATSAVAAGATGPVGVACSDEHGCGVAVSGSVTNAPPPA